MQTKSVAHFVCNETGRKDENHTPAVRPGYQASMKGPVTVALCSPSVHHSAEDDQRDVSSSPGGRNRSTIQGEEWRAVGCVRLMWSESPAYRKRVPLMDGTWTERLGRCCRCTKVLPVAAGPAAAPSVVTSYIGASATNRCAKSGHLALRS